MSENSKTNDIDNEQQYENDPSGTEQDTPGSSGVPLSRRGALAGLASIGLLGAGMTGSASAASVGDTLTFGNSFDGTSSNGYGLKIRETSGSGGNSGIRAEADAPGGKAIQAIARGNGSNYAVNGVTFSNQGTGVRGKAPSNTGSTFGVLGTSQSPDGKALQGTNFATSGNAVGLEGRTDSYEGFGLRGRATAGSGQCVGVWGSSASPNGYGLFTNDAANVGGDLEVGGDLQVTGTKNFVQTVDTTAGPKNVHYTSIEAGEVRTEHTGVAEMEDGHALIELPDHFDMVTSDEEPIAVQVTANAEEKVQPQVVEKSTRYVSVEDFSDGPDDYSISYTVKGIRAGFEDEDVVRER